MSLQIHSVVNGKTPDEEYVLLKATAPINLKGFALVDRTFDTNGNVSNEFRHIFVFPDLQVGKDDWIRLYTGKGKYSKNKFDGKENYRHKLYWQAESCVWNNNGGDSASLIKYSLVNTATVPAVK